MDNYCDKLNREREWHLKKNKLKNDLHFLNSPIFFSKERQKYNYAFAKRTMVKFIESVLFESGLENPSMLIAPIGTGNDLMFIDHITNDITGVDISLDALSMIKKTDIELFEADMSNMDFIPNNKFDLVIVPLFFHHFNGAHNIFVNELVRVLKPGGHFVSLEPSILHPFTWVTRSARRYFGNITNQVEDEAPFMPIKLKRAMVQCGLTDVLIQGASFSHNRLPVRVAKLNNYLTRPLLVTPIINQFAWLCIFYGRKKLVYESSI